MTITKLLKFLGTFIITLFLNSLFSPCSFGQMEYSGIVIDKKSKSPLPFVNVYWAKHKRGVITNIDGEFKISNPYNEDVLNFSFIGYKPYSLNVKNFDAEGMEILMQKDAFVLDEVVIFPDINPAIRIIKNVISNKEINDPNKLNSYTYESYEKTYLTIEYDSAFSDDTSSIRIRQHLDTSHLLVTENVIKKEFLAPSKVKETVIGNRVSGLRDPMFTPVFSKIQSASFYDNAFDIADEKYLNPLTKSTYKGYVFLIQDTVFTSMGDTTYVISFFPKQNTKFKALKGLLYINTFKWAVQSVIAEPEEQQNLDVKIQQDYKLINDSIWFPSQINTNIFMKNKDFEGREMKYVAIAKSYIKNVAINPLLNKKHFSNIVFELDQKANSVKGSFWRKHAKLSLKEKYAYDLMDSLGKANDFDRTIKTYSTFTNGKIPISFLDLSMRDLLSFNNFEGIRLSPNFTTNDKLSSWLKVGTYGAYGFKDHTWKYGTSVDFILNKGNEVSVGLKHKYDVEESGGINVFNIYPLTEDFSFRDLILSRMNYTRATNVNLQFRAFRNFKFYFDVHQNNKTTFDDYRFITSSNDTLRHYSFTGIKAAFRFAPGEKFRKIKGKLISMGTKCPIFYFSYDKGIKGFSEGDFDYNRYDFKMIKSFEFPLFGTTSFVITAGYVDNPIPASDLFNGNGSSYDKLPLFESNTFGTMRLNEFLSDQYAAIYFSHNFGGLLLKTKNFHPEFEIVSNFGIGNLSKKTNHLNYEFKTMDKGYFESGLNVHRVLSLSAIKLGVGVMYRYGEYAFPEFEENLTFKIVVDFGK
ncbi:MAG: DUF5686 family protein [Hyphomicrobiales bacterium]